jgi:hypothetical protein
LGWDFQSFDVAFKQKSYVSSFGLQGQALSNPLKPWILGSVIKASWKQVAKFVLLERDWYA